MKNTNYLYSAFLLFLVAMASCESPKEVIVGWGDSMMKASLSKTSILDVIGDELNIETHNFGQGGFKSYQVAVLQGAKQLLLTPNEAVMAANEDLKLMPTNIRPFTHFGRQEYPGSIQGVSGSLERIIVPGDRTTIQHYLFKREGAGKEERLRDTVVFVFDHVEKFKSSPTLIWAGRNDDKSKNRSEITVANIEEMVNTLEGPAKEKYLILSICNGKKDREAKGTLAYDRIMALNDMLEERFQEHFVDIRTYMVQQAIYDMELTPTPEDLIDMEEDQIPKIFFADNVHLNKLGNIAIGKHLVKVIQEKGWLD